MEKEQEDLCQKGLSEEEGENPLCTRLMELWSQGKLSATQAAEISHLSLLSGCQHPEILAIAKCGDYGQNKSSSHRDLVKLCCKKMHLPEPHMVKVPMKDPKTQREGNEEVALLLPHVLLGSLNENYPDVFEDIFALKGCLPFWKGVERSKDPRLVSPIALTKGKVDSPSVTIPIFIHGDGCEFQTRDSLMTWSWGSLLSQNPSLSSHLLLCSVPKSCSLPKTWEPLNAWICWSFAALAKGMHPEVDPWGKPLTKGLLAELAGLPLTKGQHRAVIWAIQGDAEFFANILHLPHWNTQFPCHECDCQKPVYRKVPCPEGKSVKLLKEEEQDFKYVSPQEAFENKRSTHDLFQIPGVSTALVRGDSLHILYSRGVASHLAGSLIHYIVFFDYPRRQKVPPTQRLQCLFARIKELYSEMQVAERLTNLRLSMVCDPTKPHKSFPCLEAKAAETKHLLPCLEVLLREVLDEENEIHGTMLQCIHALNQLIAVFDSAGVFPKEAEYKLSQNFAKRFCDSYQDLHNWFKDLDRKLFNITHKFHSAIHLFKNAKFLNFRTHHNFKSEHFVGQISVLGHSCSFGVKGTKLATKIMEKYRICLHLQLTRPGFGFVLENTDL